MTVRGKGLTKKKKKRDAGNRRREAEGGEKGFMLGPEKKKSETGRGKPLRQGGRGGG